MSAPKPKEDLLSHVYALVLHTNGRWGRQKLDSRATGIQGWFGAQAGRRGREQGGRRGREQAGRQADRRAGRQSNGQEGSKGQPGCDLSGANTVL